MNATITRPKKTSYENNPFLVAIHGVELLFDKARSIAIALIVLAGLSALSSVPSMFVQPEQPEAAPTPAAEAESKAFAESIANIPLEVWVLGGLFVLALVLVFVAVGIIIRGVLDYTSARLAAGKNVTLTEAFSAVFEQFWAYTWVLIIVTAKVLLWSLLFIVPGIIMAVRYSLAGVAFFEKGLKGDAAIQHSSQLVKGAWLTTYASQTLVSVLTLGVAQNILAPGTNAVLYRQLTPLTAPKPKAHFLSWLTLILPIVGVVFIALVVLLLVAAYVNYARVA